MSWFAQAPSNIALIKYMGKQDGKGNMPINNSFSYTLDHLFSSVMLDDQAGKEDFWEPLNIPGALEFHLSENEQRRFLEHLEVLKAYFDYSGSFVVRSSNNFPQSIGLASSASSFAALTKCAVLALSELTKVEIPSDEIQAKLSQAGSGSSCRSFYAPWVLWDDSGISKVALPYSTLIHQAILISHDEKKISSSEAHRLVRTSKLFAGRPERAAENLRVLLDALRSQDWRSAYEVCWREFHDMHQMFATSTPKFSYLTDDTYEALGLLQKLWDTENDGPIVTMDAGPNIHLLYRPDQVEIARKFKQDHLIGNHDVLEF